ncbi:uncharacterized protein LOC135491404 isoform X2 [Lineus longissimus]|uniref:uncharacterized protein LOC135491404 isoform X2 n=1 Tax=Lineus longissimus TaxID=88925 RepID=UPI00315DE35F
MVVVAASMKVNVHLIKCHKINYKVKSKCFRNGVFCGQVFINGEMRMIKKVIPDKTAADGIEIEMPHGLAVKTLDNSKGGYPVWHSFDVVDGSAPESMSGGSGHSHVVVNSSVSGLDNVLSSTQAQKLYQKTPALNERSDNDNGNSVNSQKSYNSKNHVEDALSSSCIQASMNDPFYPEMFNADELAKQILSTCNYVNPFMLNPCEFRFSNMSGSSVATVSGFENRGEVVTIPKSDGLPQANGSITLPSIAIAKSGVTKSNGGSVSPLLETKFPKLLLESKQSCPKKQKRLTKNPMRPPIEIPKVRVKVCIIPNESRYKCPDCEYITDTMPMAILHMRESQHGGMKKKTYRCQFCSKKFLLKEALCQHMKTCAGGSKHAKQHSMTGNNIASLKNNGCPEIRKVPNVEAVENNALIAQPKCAIDFNIYNSLATFGDVSNWASLKSSQHDNINAGEKPHQKKKRPTDQGEETKKIKLEPDIVKSEKEESVNELSAKPKGTALPGIGTFFSSNLVSQNMLGTNTPTTLPSFQTFLGVSTQESPRGFTSKGFSNSSLSKQEAGNGNQEKSLSSLFPWLNIETNLKSFPDELTLNHSSESDPADLIPGNHHVVLDGSLTGKPQTCLQCHAAFKTLSLLRYHQQKNSHDGYKTYPCSHCDSIFGSKGHLETHIRNHTKEKPYFCPLCHRMFSRVDLVNSHLRLQHNMSIHISGKDVLLPNYRWNSEEENSFELNTIVMDKN